MSLYTIVLRVELFDGWIEIDNCFNTPEATRKWIENLPNQYGNDKFYIVSIRRMQAKVQNLV
jgi:hypothetical protein